MDDGKRLYGVDLFKALSMLLVVALHINTVGGALEGSAAGSVQWWIADFVQIAAYCCVDCFALATGFLMAGRRFRPGRIVSLWLQVAFYSVVTAIAWYFTVPGKIDLKYIVSSFFPVHIIRSEYRLPEQHKRNRGEICKHEKFPACFLIKPVKLHAAADEIQRRKPEKAVAARKRNNTQRSERRQQRKENEYRRKQHFSAVSIKRPQHGIEKRSEEKQDKVRGEVPVF